MNVLHSARQVLPSDRAELRDRVMVPARSTWRQAWARRGVDVTAVIGEKSCLVVAPHPDDETLGCAVAIMRKREAGTKVTVVVVSDGALAEPVTLPPAELVEVRKAETRRACARLGVDAADVRFLDFPDAALGERVDEVADRLAELIRELAPEQILAPASCDGHPDHDATNDAVTRAVAAVGYRGQVLEYAVWLWTHWPWTRGYGTEPWTARRLLVDPLVRLRERRPLLVDARGYRERQQRALAEHATQVGVPSDAGSASETVSTGTPVTGSLLVTTRTRHEIYFEAGSLHHLDFDRGWRR